jgi:hypothetical protein
MVFSLRRQPHVRGFDDRDRRLAFCEFQLIDRLIGDRSGQDSTPNIDAHMGGCRALHHLDHGSLELIARAEPHDLPSPVFDFSQFHYSWLYTTAI